ncbi:hypothetical protein [Methylophaga nitratireducenticrescens]|uniref:hypothetical protein n=1 Tax=Methylophaga nitratireducenticrescens TaxID=754476 RepID=UPI00146F23A0|nr:hypothetical protein [Methylophaga nitratireducenticrescens]
MWIERGRRRRRGRRSAPRLRDYTLAELHNRAYGYQPDGTLCVEDLAEIARLRAEMQNLNLGGNY